jgi:hypothetical protein
MSVIPGFSLAARVMAWIYSKVRSMPLDGGGLLGTSSLLSAADLLLSAIMIFFRNPNGQR